MVTCRSVDFRLYLITDRGLFEGMAAMYFAIDQALKGGVKAVQLREKDLPTRELLDMAYGMRELTNGYGAKLFINDRADIAMAVEADGVHLGRTSIPVNAVRKAAGEKMLIGVSTHSIEEAKEAREEGADFITLGPVYETPSKLQYGKPLGFGALKQVCSMTSVPVFAIGGIKTGNAAAALDAGAYGLALISGILASDNARSTTEEYMRLLK